MTLRSLLPALVLTLIGCGSVDPSASPGPGAGGDGAGGSGGSLGPQGPLLPWEEGNKWTYRITKDGVTSVKTTTIGELTAVGGVGPNADLMAYHVVTAKGAELADRTESWQAQDPEDEDRIIRFRELSFDATTGELELEEYWDAAKLHIDGSPARTVKDASWLETYQEYKLEVGLSPTDHEVRERWTVLDDDATVEVPAGTFEHAIHLQKIGSSTTKEYWYLRGVGKLKETGSQTEELEDYELRGAP
ncbi:MAG: hypothetical protein K0R38_1405 [Polyangiaceae bacterium]|jgi:hypothetical protein|nr:hypothetical protein [Polyangiaceae bacterium]